MTGGRKLKIAIVGAGNLGSVLAVALRRAGHEISEIMSRAGKPSERRAGALARKVGAKATLVNDAQIMAPVVWFCVPDREIVRVARNMAKTLTWKGRIAVHSSGALASDELDALRYEGAAVASAHPLMTFVPEVTALLAGVGFAVEGDPLAVRTLRRIVSSIGGKVFSIRKKDKVLYHAWGTFASPLLTALLALGERVAGAAGVNRNDARQRAFPILRQTLDNYAKRGAAGGFSGPIVRGDALTVQRHLKALQRVPDAEEVYRALARSALRTLPVRNRQQLSAVLRGER